MAALTSALLYLDGVTVSFDGFKALNNLSFMIEPGEMRAIIGPNGAGKTTMMDVVTGKTRPDRGDVVFSGAYDLTRLDETEIAELGIGRKFQKPTVFDSHTVFDNVELALKADRRARATLLWRETASEDERIDEILKIARLSAVRDRLAGSLSHGQKQWLEIGMLLAQDPKLLLGRRTGCRHDRYGDSADGRAAQGDQPRTHRHCGRARHDVRARPWREGHVPARGIGARRRHDRSSFDQ